MPHLHLLGTGAGLSDASRTTTMLAVRVQDASVVVDCGGDVVQRLLAARIPLDGIEALVVTHEHPDHVAGFPLFMERIWLGGRRRPIDVFGPAPALSQARRIWEAFDTESWEGMPEIRWREVPLEEGTEIVSDDRWRITASPGTHSVPVIGLRVDDPRAGGSVCYSCDTEKSEAIARLARGVDLLVHEATGGFGGHTSAVDAARIARESGAGRLVLVHLPPNLEDEDLGEAREIFARTELGQDGGRYTF